jgi:hypothetical protein
VKQLHLIYKDLIATVHAATRLNKLKQSTKLFVVFITDFNCTILEARGAA